MRPPEEFRFGITRGSSADARLEEAMFRVYAVEGALGHPPDPAKLAAVAAARGELMGLVGVCGPAFPSGGAAWRHVEAVMARFENAIA